MPPVPLLLSSTFLARLDQLVLVTRRARVGAFKGERRSPRRGGSIEFADYREYAPGDDFRQVDWNAYARLERLFLRLFVEEEDVTVHILLDASASMNWGEPVAEGGVRSKWHYAQRLAAALGYIVLVGMDRLVAAAVVAKSRDLVIMQPLRGKSSAPAWFNWLTALEPGGSAAPYAALTRYAAQTRRAGPLILISDLLDDGWQKGIQQLNAQQYEIGILHLLSPDEIEPTFEGDLKLLDSERDAPVEITADYDLLERYHRRVREWQNEWATFCAARGINYVPLTTAQPLEKVVLSLLRKHQVVK